MARTKVRWRVDHDYRGQWLWLVTWCCPESGLTCYECGTSNTADDALGQAQWLARWAALELLVARSKRRDLPRKPR
jgi:hypothetical protein